MIFELRACEPVHNFINGRTPILVFGVGVADDLGDLCDRNAWEKIAIITGKNSLLNSGYWGPSNVFLPVTETVCFVFQENRHL